MRYPKFVKSIFVLLLLLHVSQGADTELEEEKRNSTERPTYCFRFTWLGPSYYDESAIKNLTCSDLLENTDGVPCKHPLTITDNSAEPNTSWVWNEMKKTNFKTFGCRLSPSEVCVKYSYKFNGAVENITYMCSKVKVGDQSPQSGCFVQNQNGSQTQVCVCRGKPEEEPCNTAFSFHINYHSIILIFVLNFICRKIVHNAWHIKKS